MRIQRVLNSDIAMIFDECTPYPADETRGRATRCGCRCAGRSAASAPHARAIPTRCSASSRAACTRRLRDESLAGLTAHRLRRLRHRRAVGGRAEGGHAPHPRAHRAAAAGGPAALPDGRGHAGGHRRGGRGRASTCSTACCRRATRATAGCSPASATSRSGTPRYRDDTRPLDATCGCYTCAHFTPRLPASPAEGQRDPRRAPQHPAQPALLPDADARAARGDRRRRAWRTTRRGSRERRARLEASRNRRGQTPRARNAARSKPRSGDILPRSAETPLETNVLISPAFAQARPGVRPAPATSSSCIIILMFALLYFLHDPPADEARQGAQGR